MRRPTCSARAATLFASSLLPVLIVLIFALAGAAWAGERPFIQRLSSQPLSLDPAKSNRSQDDQVIWLLYDALTQLSADGTRMEPALAERWEQSADGLTFTFHLRRNVRFHDGSPLDAEAVKASYERQFRPGSPFYSATPRNVYEGVLAGLVKEIRVVDPLTVAITLQYPRPSQFALVKIVSPRALQQHGKDLTRRPVGTGPFRLDRWEENRIDLAAVPDSWHGRSKLDQVVFTVEPDTQVTIERLEAGEYDLVPDIPPQFFERLAANPLVRLVKVGGLNLWFLGMQMDRPALQDRRVREAVVRAIDRERLATYVGRGTMLAARGPLPPTSLGYDPQIQQPAHDLPRARALLHEAGVGADLSLRFLYNAPLELWAEVVQAIRSDLRKAGLGVDLVPVSDWTAFHQERRKGGHDLYLYKWNVSTPDPERFLLPLYQSKSPDNFGHFSQPKVDELLDQARQPMGDARRLQTYQEITRLIVAAVPAAFLLHQINVAAHHARVTGLTLSLYGFPQDKLVTVTIR